MKTIYIFPTENVTSSSTAVSFAVTSYTLLVSTAQRTTAPLTPSSVYSLIPSSVYSSSLHSSAYDVAKTNTLRSYGSSANKGGNRNFTSRMSGHGVTQTKLPCFSALVTTGALHNINTESASFLVAAHTTASDVSKSSSVSSCSLDKRPSLLTTSSESRKVQRTEATQVTIPPSLLYSTSVISESSTYSPQTGARTMISTPYVVPLCTSDKDVIDQQTETARTQLHSTLGLQHQTSLSQLNSPLSASGPQKVAPTLMPTPSIGSLCTTNEEVTTQPTLTFDSTLGLQQQTSSSQEFSNPSFSSSLTSVAPTFTSTPSVGSRCNTNEEVTAPPTFQPDETSAIPGIIVEFQPIKKDKELVRILITF